MRRGSCADWLDFSWHFYFSLHLKQVRSRNNSVIKRSNTHIPVPLIRWKLLRIIPTVSFH